MMHLGLTGRNGSRGRDARAVCVPGASCGAASSALSLVDAATAEVPASISFRTDNAPPPHTVCFPSPSGSLPPRSSATPPPPARPQCSPGSGRR
ncbi:hypothetical protein MUK42_34811 [Musa troglodytarum]|uniref:Uncharacterized protein n=1 Tax=Musa troglodytarum TaxID=320322 RepID=A0A9E7H8R8_9LILI|nr:hypothetical protein MUK42_34811 [Musa troglodytarum]